MTYGDVLGLEDFASRSGRESDWDEGLDILGIKVPSEIVLDSVARFKDEFNRLSHKKSEEETTRIYQKMADMAFPRLAQAFLAAHTCGVATLMET